ncbi:MAG: hypothetical protein APF77_00405 [Clostridia bacterium BRH_c25]|nr:MAG: hypothetical protein APF77_00405 [Clostridia bacterium BRH_c25]
MSNMIRSFKELTPEHQTFAGGKGGMLARMYQSGYPVPDGFVVLPSAFQDEKLNKEALNEIRKKNAGAAGRIEGVVRILTNPEEGEKLQTGEILVAVTTNIGWTPLFPKAAAIITDIGAPLSHAAIVARELGIPAVVGCTNATIRLKTGDRVLVDGGHGVVQILN